ncbi:MAG: TonB-dependent receptor, partial [Emcibacteraceae bacterium]|nr:TonB-dependent receptor [Emcibacteraceae bacterium]
MIRSIVICVFCTLSLWWQCVAWGDTLNDTSTMLQFDVSGQSADDGLREFARQAGLAVIFRQQSVIAFTTNIVKGSYDINAGLARLLDSTGLEGRISKNGTIVIETTPSIGLIATKSSEGKQMNNKVLKNKLKKGTSSFLMSFLIATGLVAQDSNMQKATAQQAADEGEDIIVVTGRRMSTAADAIGEGEAGNTISVTREALLSAPSGVSGLKALEGLPGFNVQTDGALGLYEFGNSVTVRAFNFQQVGFVLDGIPMGRPDAFGGSPIFRYVDNENLQQVRASPGSGDISLPSATSLGPVVEYITTAPSNEPSASLQITFGDDNLQRTFIKLETGDLDGFSGYVSRSKTDSDLWRGPGTIDREHFEGKIRYEFDDDSYISAQIVHNDFFDYDSPSVSRAAYDATTDTSSSRNGVGRNIAYLGTVPDLGVGPNVQFENGSYTGYYIDRVNVRKDLLFGLTLATNLTDNLDFLSTGYYEDKDGFGVSPDGYSNTLGHYNEQIAAGVPAAFGLPLTMPRGVQYGLSSVGGDRKGATARFTYHVANHKIEIGGWFEKETYNRTQLRLNKEGGNPAGELLPNEVAYYRRNYTTDRDFLQYNIKDTFSVMDDRLTIEVGFKGLYLDYKLTGFRDFDDYSLSGGLPGHGPQAVGSKFNDGFLPMAGMVYKITDTDQVFASYSQNFSLPRGADALFDNIVTPDIGGEKSTNYEVGIRTNRPTFNGALAFYYIDFDDRIETAGREIVGQPGQIETIAQNVGSVEAYGIEFTGNWKPASFN